ncbi:ribonuclease H-like protein [Xylaria nigripes]|nr:ribonuclease H-like protein [Xylaria nigripes]
MPLARYYTEGLVPLGYASSDDDESPFELPDGQLVCGLHGLITCYKCTVDFSFLYEDLEQDQDDSSLDEEAEAKYWRLPPEVRGQVDAIYGPREVGSGNPSAAHAAPTNSDAFTFGPKKHRGTGRVFPTNFNPPSASIQPTELFTGKATYANITRYIHREESRKVLILTDGACLNNGQANPKAGWAFVQGPGRAGQAQPAVVSMRLENKGPWDDASIQSSNRAELRAVIAALRFRHWTGEGFDTMVIATDSEYVTLGATTWTKKWVKNDWQTAAKIDVKNKDLWEMLLGEVERWYEEGLSIQFWQIPREWNTAADAAAKKAAEQPDEENWSDLQGICY